jgi:hypothetical protein
VSFLHLHAGAADIIEHRCDVGGVILFPGMLMQIVDRAPS